MSVKLDKASRLRFSTLRIIDGIELWAEDALPTIDINGTDTVYVVKDDLDRIDTISYKSYKTEVLWWVIARINGIYDLFNDMEIYLILWTDNNVSKKMKIIGYSEANFFVEKLRSRGITDIEISRESLSFYVPTKSRVFGEIMP